jgi:hypothetical protein
MGNGQGRRFHCIIERMSCKEGNQGAGFRCGKHGRDIGLLG